ncbi:MAG: tRNA (adenosine(37)-N6)-threonylcarbamoyltransferase complex dimerization subunit type 1 TsaB [Alphaproteobacteria bacterium]
MNVLGLDAACAACSVAFLRDGRIVSHRYRAMLRGQVEALIPMAVETMKLAGGGFEDLDCVAVTVGPGSFTGLRAGLAAAQGLSRALGIRLHGVTTLEAVAFAARRDTTDMSSGAALVVALDSRREEIFLQCFGADLAPLTEAASVLPRDAAALLPDAPLVVAGDGAARLQEALAKSEKLVKIVSGPGQPDACDVALIAAGRAGKDGDDENAPPPRPVYLHPPHVTMPKAQGRLRS